MIWWAGLSFRDLLQINFLKVLILIHNSYHSVISYTEKQNYMSDYNVAHARARHPLNRPPPRPPTYLMFFDLDDYSREQ